MRVADNGGARVLMFAIHFKKRLLFYISYFRVLGGGVVIVQRAEFHCTSLQKLID